MMRRWLESCLPMPASLGQALDLGTVRAVYDGWGATVYVIATNCRNKVEIRRAITVRIGWELAAMLMSGVVIGVVLEAAWTSLR